MIELKGFPAAEPMPAGVRERCPSCEGHVLLFRENAFQIQVELV